MNNKRTRADINDIVSSSNKRPRSEDVKMPRRRVSFSSSIEHSVISTPTEDPRHKWYSRDEGGRIQRAAWEEARRLGNLLANGERFADRDYYECIGIEKILSRDTLDEISAMRRAHVHAVVMCQRLFDKDEAVLCSVSETSSRWARQRAYELGMVYLQKDDSK